uniref:(northern house mosquito) hypothetical protein n=1 Tax=Culex pipiens TaxID=7175 RepID=A0A8D8BHL9_CULPI
MDTIRRLTRETVSPNLRPATEAAGGFPREGTASRPTPRCTSSNSERRRRLAGGTRCRPIRGTGAPSAASAWPPIRTTIGTTVTAFFPRRISPTYSNSFNIKTKTFSPNRRLSCSSARVATLASPRRNRPRLRPR